MSMHRQYLYAGDNMALQIANPAVVEKVNRLAALTGLSKTAAVEVAVDALLAESALTTSRRDGRARMDAMPSSLAVQGR